MMMMLLQCLNGIWGVANCLLGFWLVVNDNSIVVGLLVRA